MQLVSEETLLHCKIKPGHAAEIFARLKEVLGTPPVSAPRVADDNCPCREWSREKAFRNLLLDVRVGGDSGSVSEPAGPRSKGRRKFSSDQLKNEPWLAMCAGKPVRELRKNVTWKVDQLRKLCTDEKIAKSKIAEADKLAPPKGAARCVACRPEADMDGDGYVSTTEFAAFIQKQTGLAPTAFDRKAFNDADENADGQMDRAEFKKLKQSMAFSRGGGGKGLPNAEPVKVFMSVLSPPQVQDVDTTRMVCDVRFLFDAIWRDPRLVQSGNVSIRPGDPVVAPWNWRPRFSAVGSSIEFEMTRLTYHDPYHGYLKAQYRAKGTFPLDEATSAGRVSIAIKLRLQRFTQDMVQLWHSRRFKEHNPGVIELGNDWDRFTNPDHPEFVSPSKYTRLNVLAAEYRQCNGHTADRGFDNDDGDDNDDEPEDAWGEKLSEKKDTAVGLEVLTSTYDNELLDDIQICEMRKDDPGFVRGIFLANIFKRHLRSHPQLTDIPTRESLTEEHSQWMIDCLKEQYDRMTDNYADEDDGDDDATTESDPDATHGRVVDRRDSGDLFSIMQITLRLQRREGFFFLNSDLRDRPPLSVVKRGGVPLGRYKVVIKLPFWRELPFQPGGMEGVVDQAQALARGHPLYYHEWNRLKDAVMAKKESDFDGKMENIIINVLGVNWVENPRTPGKFFKFARVIEDNDDVRYVDMSIGQKGFRKLEDPIHVYVVTTVLNIPAINSAASTVSVKLSVAAYWKDPRMEGMWSKPNVKITEHDSMWYPNLRIVNADEITAEMTTLRLINPETGLLRADYDMRGTIHNPMSLHSFPLDTDIVAIELHAYGQKRVELHTKREFRSGIHKYFRKASTLDELATVTRSTAAAVRGTARKSSEEHQRLLDRKMVQGLHEELEKDEQAHRGGEGGSDRDLTAALGVTDAQDTAWYRDTDFCIFTRAEVNHMVGIEDRSGSFHTAKKKSNKSQKQKGSKAGGGGGSGSSPVSNPMFSSGGADDDSASSIDPMHESQDLEVDEDWAAAKEYMKKMRVIELEAMCTARDVAVPHHHLSVFDKERYREQLIVAIKAKIDADARAKQDQDLHENRIPQDLLGVHLNPELITMHDWEVCGQIAMNTDQDNVKVMIRVHRKPGYYFWKIIFVLHMLVLLTLVCFLFPADGDGSAIRMSISSTMFLALTGLLYVAAETLPPLEYLTSCDKLIVVATVLVFFVNVWNGLIFRMWTAESEGGTEGAMEALASEEELDCPGINGAGVPLWYSWFLNGNHYEGGFVHSADRMHNCWTSVWDETLGWVCVGTFAAADVMLFMPPWLRRLRERTLAEIADVETRVFQPEDMEEAEAGEDDN